MSRYRCWVALAVMLSFGGGCMCVQNRHQGCADSCCPNPDDPILGDCNKCGVCGGNDCPGYTPCGYLKYMLTCGAGCSEIYWGEWISEPPDCCDPCDHCGNWTGPGCCRRKPVVNALKALWGERYFGGCCSTCGDTGCDGGCGSGPASGYTSGVAHPMHRGHAIQRRHRPAPLEEEMESAEDAQPAEPVPARRAPPSRPTPPADPEPKAAKPRSTRSTQAQAKSAHSVRNASTTKSPWQPR